ncbi:hypothetical protein AVEN_9642-1 [Araneus ventricosus]|uniref:Uncharacterized protein n=1 Tax=Araneus ventricosus TaxID=182803 RepID=A0A4Y2EW58_ARAVE|nr:hypothetical protein AVEN_9642-1 [Araneus ventricosus]
MGHSAPFGAHLTKQFQIPAHQFRWVIHEVSMYMARSFQSPRAAVPIPTPTFPRKLHSLISALVRGARSPLPTIVFQFYGLVLRMKNQTRCKSKHFNHTAPVLIGFWCQRRIVENGLSMARNGTLVNVELYRSVKSN